MNGIQYVQDQKIFVTNRSTNIIKEYRNYLWKVDKNGTVLNEPEHEFSHSMDAIRYGFSFDITAHNPIKSILNSVETSPLYPDIGI